MNQTASVDDIWNKTSFGEVGVAAAAGGAAALTGVGAGALAAAGAGALGAGAVGTGIAAGAVGGGVTAGLDSLSGQAIEVGAGRADNINWGKVGTDTAVGVAVGGVLGGVAGKVSSELDKLGKSLADAGAKGFQEGAAELAGVRSAATRGVAAVEGGAGTGASGGVGSRAVTQVVEASQAPGTAAAGPRGLPGPGVRPTWQASESTATRTLEEAGFREQVSFRGGQEVPYGTPDSVRPDLYSRNHRMSVDVKNYNVETAQGRSRLVRNVVDQAKERAAHLPAGTRQGLLIDARGQKPDPGLFEKMLRRLVRKTGGLIDRDNVEVLGDGE